MRPSSSLSDSDLIDSLAPVFPRSRIEIRGRRKLHSFQHIVDDVEAEVDGRRFDFFLRIYRGRFSWWTRFADIEAREKAAFRFLAETRLRIPQVLLRGSSAKGSFAIAKKIPGQVLSDERSSLAIRTSARILHRLHTSDWRRADLNVIPDVRLDRFFPCLKSWARDPSHLQEIEELRLKFSTVVEHPAFLHGDCHHGNFLVSGDSMAILDFEEVCIGDVRLDLASHAARLVQDFSFEAAREFLYEYQSLIDWDLGPIAIWEELLELRDRILSKQE